MPQYKKAILRVGTYQSPDGTVQVTPQRLKHWANQFRKMKARNLAVPVSFDHSDDYERQIPVAFSTDRRKALSAVNAVGHLSDFKVAADGKSAEIVLDLPDEKAAAKAEQNVVEVSPVIHPTWRDGRGNSYRDVIGHMDLVVHPVDNSQTKFKRLEGVAMSIRMSLGKGKKGAKVYRMADDQDDDNKRDDEERDDAIEMAEEDTPPADDVEVENPDMPNVEDTTGAGDEQLEAIIAHLEVLGVALPADTTSENFTDRLLTALKTVEAMKAAQDAEDAADAENDETESEELTVADPQFAAMSLQARAAVQYTNALHRKELNQRLDSLLKTGRCSPAEADKHRKAISAVKLSLDRSGNPRASDTEKWIADRESLPEGAVWDSTTRMSLLTESRPPADLISGNSFDGKQVDEAANLYFGRR